MEKRRNAPYVCLPPNYAAQLSMIIIILIISMNERDERIAIQVVISQELYD